MSELDNLKLENHKLRRLLVALGEWSDYTHGCEAVGVSPLPFKTWCDVEQVYIDWELYMLVMKGTKLHE